MVFIIHHANSLFLSYIIFYTLPLIPYLFLYRYLSNLRTYKYRSASMDDVLSFPAYELISFLCNHKMLQLFNRPEVRLSLYLSIYLSIYSVHTNDRNQYDSIQLLSLTFLVFVL